nr:helix-turn-helix domain-containing protein [Phocaeicola barnesiae]
MERDRPFLNPELNISLLAKAAITNRTHLSNAINRMTGTNFSTWLAEYRVNYAIHLMTHNDAVNVDTIYTQAGFGSRTTFYRQFKQLTGLTPKQFLKQRVS